MKDLARRSLMKLGGMALLSILLPRRVKALAVSRDIVVVDGWVLRHSDLDIGTTG